MQEILLFVAKSNFFLTSSLLVEKFCLLRIQAGLPAKCNYTTLLAAYTLCIFRRYILPARTVSAPIIVYVHRNRFGRKTDQLFCLYHSTVHNPLVGILDSIESTGLCFRNLFYSSLTTWFVSRFQMW